MIHLHIKQDYVSTKNSLIVSDEKGKECYLIVGKWGRVGDGFSLFGIDGDLIIEVKQTTLSLFPKFNLIIAGKKIATIKKYRGLKGPYFKVSPLAWSVKGDFNTNHYRVKKGKKTIMEMEKTYLSFGDSYTLSIEQQKNVPICLCLAVIVDHLSVTREPAKVKRLKKQAIQFI
ncbi:Uncharacterized protein YxjI [Carnobacterium iners]|uniref:Uncharacterized protein YxjI n=1 Tax=Carnobacterium iners TaxID=1073423 RepID=A0A1X7N4L0_9LACT|nr:LURP-one-related family protein [Carnobacterium iners]SEL19567.1 Uncharacterized protein YxjI [Carnobacterium iners]SMH31432.1 Uncharacterized protein YxjI [Carnobacterium iners]